MCGIVGVVFAAPPEHGDALDVVLRGLKRLEYRGYDSAGVAVVRPAAPGDASGHGSLLVTKRAGKFAALTDAVALLDGARPVQSQTAIGHTRWATHGGPTDVNAHPHTSADGRLAVIHNGIIENYTHLRRDLAERGISQVSQTDTEVVAHLLRFALDDAAAAGTPIGLAEAMRQVCRRLDGAFTLLVVSADHPGVIVAARRSSPLVVGVGDGAMYLGSDVAAFIDDTREAIELAEDQVVEITGTTVEITDFYGQPAVGRRFRVDWDPAAAEKGGYDSYMAKEIDEQPRAVADTLRARVDLDGRLMLDEIRISEDDLRAVDRIIVVACGTAAYAGMVARYAIEHWCRIPVEVELAHEFRYRDPIVDARTLVVAISQSGETMDTLMAVRHARAQGARVLSICNTYGATIPRESDAALYTHAGPEVAVASTKSFVAQMTAAYLLGLYLAQLQGTKFADEIAEIVDQLRAMPDKIQKVLDGMDHVRQVARDLSGSRTVLFLGRHVGFPVALEGALKLKELAYIHAEGFAAGELKHGPIALVEPGQPVVIVVPSPRGRDMLHAKVVSNIQEVRARGALTIVIAEEGDVEVEQHADVVIRVPQTPTLLAPLVTVVPLQVFAAELATAKGLDIDQPRNLAKSVTVE